MPFGALNVASAAATPRHSAKMERLSALADAETAKVAAECRWREWARRGGKKLNRSSFFAECRGGGRGQRRGSHFHCLMQPLFDRLMRVLTEAKSRYSKKIEIRTPNISLEPHHTTVRTAQRTTLQAGSWVSVSIATPGIILCVLISTSCSVWINLASSQPTCGLAMGRLCSGRVIYCQESCPICWSVHWGTDLLSMQK